MNIADEQSENNDIKLVEASLNNIKMTSNNINKDEFKQHQKKNF